jgi:hypothetical protein
MAQSLADLRKQRTTDFGNITAALGKKTEYAKDDEGFWKPTQDKAGNATAVIRFLPRLPEDELPYVQLYSHSFQHPAKTGKWFIDNCPTTVGRDECPVCKLNKGVYASMSKDAAQKIAGARSRKQHWIANILVIEDTANPDNNGKVFRYKFGKVINEKIKDKAVPVFKSDKAVDVYDLWEGANFRLHMAKVDGYPNYDKSSFDVVSALEGTDDEIQALLDQRVVLAPFVAPDKFKSEAELQKRLDFVMGATGIASTAQAEDMVRAMTQEVRAAAPKAKAAPEAKVSEPAAEFEDVPNESDLEDYFAKLAK